METLIGKTLDQTYRVDALLGQGGMGAVYRARDITLERDVAIKVMHPHYTGTQAFRARFLQEARAIAALDHPCIVRVHAFKQDLGLLYIVMDYVPGQTLQAWLQHLASEHKILGLAESLALIRQVALALDYAHAKGVLHRDVKPSNILLPACLPGNPRPASLPVSPQSSSLTCCAQTWGSMGSSLAMPWIWARSRMISNQRRPPCVPCRPAQTS